MPAVARSASRLHGYVHSRHRCCVLGLQSKSCPQSLRTRLTRDPCKPDHSGYRGRCDACPVHSGSSCHTGMPIPSTVTRVKVPVQPSHHCRQGRDLSTTRRGPATIPSMRTTGACDDRTTSAASERCPRSCMPAVVRPCCCTFCCTELTCKCQGSSVRLPGSAVRLLHRRWPLRPEAKAACEQPRPLRRVPVRFSRVPGLAFRLALAVPGPLAGRGLQRSRAGPEDRFCEAVKRHSQKFCSVTPRQPGAGRGRPGSASGSDRGWVRRTSGSA